MKSFIVVVVVLAVLLEQGSAQPGFRRTTRRRGGDDSSDNTRSSPSNGPSDGEGTTRRRPGIPGLPTFGPIMPTRRPASSAAPADGSSTQASQGPTNGPQPTQPNDDASSSTSGQNPTTRRAFTMPPLFPTRRPSNESNECRYICGDNSEPRQLCPAVAGRSAMCCANGEQCNQNEDGSQRNCTVIPTTPTTTTTTTTTEATTTTTRAPAPQCSQTNQTCPATSDRTEMRCYANQYCSDNGQNRRCRPCEGSRFTTTQRTTEDPRRPTCCPPSINNSGMCCNATETRQYCNRARDENNEEYLECKNYDEDSTTAAPRIALFNLV